MYLKLETKLTIPMQREIQIKRDEITLAHLNAGGPAWNTTRFREHLGLIVDRESRLYGTNANGSSKQAKPADNSANKKSKKPLNEFAGNVVTSPPLSTGGKDDFTSPTSVSSEGGEN